MKKIITLSLLLMILFKLGEAQDASETSTDKNVVKVNAISILVGTGSFFYERKINEMSSAQLGVGYLNFKFGDNDAKFTGLILTPEYRFYVKNNAIDGFYIAPYLRYNRFELSDNTDKGVLTVMGGGVSFGRQWISKSGFTFDLFFGGHYGDANYKVETGTESDEGDVFAGFRTRIGVCIGFSF